MNWSVAKIGTIYQKPAHAIGLSAPPTPPIGCVLDLAGLPEVGNKIYDRSPYGNHGAITGATWKRLPSGLWVLDFDGTDDVITGSDAALPSGTTARSVLMWVNLDVLKDYQAFFSYGTGANGQALMFTSDHAAGAGTDKLLVGRYGAGQTASTGSISASIWQLIGFTMDANLAIIHYINGVASGTGRCRCP